MESEQITDQAQICAKWAPCLNMCVYKKAALLRKLKKQIHYLPRKCKCCGTAVRVVEQKINYTKTSHIHLRQQSKISRNEIQISRPTMILSDLFWERNIAVGHATQPKTLWTCSIFSSAPSGSRWIMSLLIWMMAQFNGTIVQASRVSCPDVCHSGLALQG